MRNPDIFLLRWDGQALTWDRTARHDTDHDLPVRQRLRHTVDRYPDWDDRIRKLREDLAAAGDRNERLAALGRLGDGLRLHPATAGGPWSS